MGIQGLMSYIGSKKYCFNELRLRDTKLVIDGNNLYHMLYFDTGLDLVHGGDYHSFSEIVQKFFESLVVCGVEAYVVFDGGCDISDKKLETQKQRVKEKIKRAQSLSMGQGGTVLPLLAREVFIQALVKMQVPFVQCFAEADKDIVALANLWNCPVLTNDSDFCIFDLKAGFCPLSCFQWKNIVTSKGNHECYIPAKCFSAQQFCSHFNNMNMTLLPLFAVIHGNDYISLQILDTFFRKVHLPIGNSSHGGKKQTRIHGLLNWLSTFADVEEALDNVLQHLKSQDRGTIKELLCSAMVEYNLSDSINLECYFQTGSYTSPVAMNLKLPEWLQRSLARGQISPLLSDVLVLRRTFLHTQVEDMKKPSAYLLTQPIRKVVYGLLLNSSPNLEQSNQANNQPHKMFVVEFERLNTTLRKSSVETTDISDGFTEIISLQKLPELSVAIRLKLLLDTLDIKLGALESVPPSHRLAVAAASYWVRYADPKVKLHHLKALIIGMVCGEMYEMLDNPDSEIQGDVIRSLSELQNIMEGKPQQRRPNSEDLHIFCQWQCCLQVALHFNQLLSTPLQQPNICSLYSGTLVHHLSHKLKSSSSVENLFNQSPPLKKLYQDCMDAVMSAIPPDCFQSRTKSKSGKSKRVKEPTKREENTKEHTVVENQPKCDVSNRFAGLFLDD
ncbi:single-strand DNA endonuclease ASTE1 [Rhinophrynus dorsalis]